MLSHLLAYSFSYLAGVALLAWVNVRILCLADAKFGDGCSGLGMYLPLWLLCYAPLALAGAAIATVPPRRVTSSRRRRLLALYLVLVLLTLEVSWLLDLKWTALLVEYAAWLPVFIVLRVSSGWNQPGVDDAPPASS